MTRPTGRLVWLLFRIVVYLGIVVALFLTRGAGHRSGWSGWLPAFPGRDSSLAIGGQDLAPGLVRQLVAEYRRDYPQLRIDLAGGGTAQGLEALANARADVAFLIRPPAPREQELLRSAGRDTLLWFPVALGGIVVLGGEASAVESLRVEDLRRFVAGAGSGGAFDRLYVPDPNSGLWEVFLDRVGLPADTLRRSQVIFLGDEAAVQAAVAADGRSLGLASSLSLAGAGDLRNPGVNMVPVAPAGGGPAMAPGYENIGYGRYPLYHYLYAACRPEGGVSGTMFVTHLTSDRGQRQVERAGQLPARQVLREIYLTTHPVGQSP